MGEPARAYMSIAAHVHSLLHQSSDTPVEVGPEFDRLLLSAYHPDDLAVGSEELLRRLARDAPQSMCMTSFSYGDVIWKCRTCQVGDDTCVICQACFQGGDHQGHDVSFYISRQTDGGCCDCGKK